MRESPFINLHVLEKIFPEKSTKNHRYLKVDPLAPYMVENLFSNDYWFFKKSLNESFMGGRDSEEYEGEYRHPSSLNYFTMIWNCMITFLTLSALLRIT